MQSPLFELRTKLNLKQGELAQMAKVSQAHISNVECGNSGLSSKLLQFLKSIHIDTNELVERQEVFIDFVSQWRKEKIKNLQLQD